MVNVIVIGWPVAFGLSRAICITDGNHSGIYNSAGELGTWWWCIYCIIQWYSDREQWCSDNVNKIQSNCCVFSYPSTADRLVRVTKIAIQWSVWAMCAQNEYWDVYSLIRGYSGHEPFGRPGSALKDQKWTGETSTSCSKGHEVDRKVSMDFFIYFVMPVGFSNLIFNLLYSTANSDRGT